MTRRRRHTLLAPTLIALVACLLVAGCSNGGKKATATKAAAVAAAPSTSTPPTTSVDESTLVATPAQAIPTFSVPGGPVNGTLPATWHGAASTLPVIAQQPGWLQVRLAQRPNESTAWVLSADMTLATTPYRVVIDLATTHLTLYKSGVAIFSAPVGVGTPAYPTPTGHYFVAFFAAPPSPGYGPFVMVLSAHSNTITDWESSAMPSSPSTDLSALTPRSQPPARRCLTVVSGSTPRTCSSCDPFPPERRSKSSPPDPPGPAPPAGGRRPPQPAGWCDQTTNRTTAGGRANDHSRPESDQPPGSAAAEYPSRSTAVAAVRVELSTKMCWVAACMSRKQRWRAPGRSPSLPAHV